MQRSCWCKCGGVFVVSYKRFSAASIPGGGGIYTVLDVRLVFLLLLLLVACSPWRRLGCCQTAGTLKLGWNKIKYGVRAFRGGLATSIMQSNELKAAYSRLPGRFFWTGLRRVRPPSLSQHSRDSRREADAGLGFVKAGEWRIRWSKLYKSAPLQV